MQSALCCCFQRDGPVIFEWLTEWNLPHSLWEGFQYDCNIVDWDLKPNKTNQNVRHIFNRRLLQTAFSDADVLCVLRVK